jgi:hypothetical protein
VSYKFNPLTGKLDLVGSSGSQSRIVEERVITLTESNNKTLILNNTPSDPSSVVLDIISGVPQSNGSDFNIVGNSLIWNGFALETTLEQNDKIRIIYTL